MNAQPSRPATTAVPSSSDVVIVGAGAAGCLLAAKLAPTGRRVTVLEAGPAWATTDLWSSQLWARRLKWRGPPVISGGVNPISHNVVTGSGLGGAALHHYGTWPRFSAEVFEIGSRYGRGVDWPFKYDVLRPFYDRIQQEVGISGDATQEPWRPPGNVYPMPPLKSFRHGELLRDGFRKTGLAVAPLPAAINSVVYQGRPPCLYDGWCDAGCPIGALGNPLVTYWPAAVAAGARLFTDCQVTRLVADAHGRIGGVEYVHAGTRAVISAGTIVLAASVIENPRILFNSHNAQHPQGLGNNTSQLGKGVMAEIMAFAYGLFEGPVDNHLGVSAGQFMHRGPLVRPELPGLIGGHQWQIAPALKPNDIFGLAVTRPQLHGKALDGFIRRATRELAYMVGFGGGLADPSNAIAVDQNRKDAFGMPLARVQHRFTAEQEKLWHFMVEEGLRVTRNAGAHESWSGPMGTGHLIGGTVMGRDPAQSVTDEYGALHDVPNVYITGSGLFPASGGVSPTFTLHAVTLRTAERMLHA